MRIHAKARLFLALVLAALYVLCISAAIPPHVRAEARQDVRVGVYDNYPKIYRDEKGDVKGVWADITNAIAKK
jgi:ABC-type amino acid transport substrate-binding protein